MGGEWLDDVARKSGIVKHGTQLEIVVRRTRIDLVACKILERRPVDVPAVVSS